MQRPLTHPSHDGTTSLAAPQARYPAIETHYGQLLASRLGTAVVVTKKWQDTDLVWPHSDIDLRIIVDGPPVDWISFNEQLAQLQRDLVTADRVLRRVLEHPPGWVFLRHEVEAGLVPAAEVATWSHSFGDHAAVDQWRADALARRWSVEDDRFYRGIIAARVDGAYRLEVDSADNVVFDAERYGAHCVSWHYLAPVVFATASLHSRRRLSGKTEALHAYPTAAVTEFLSLARNGYRDAPRPAALLRQAHRAIHALLVLPEPALSTDGTPTRAEVASAVGVLRCRIARYSYYLAPPTSAETGYLIDRETKDLHGAIRILRAACPTLPTPLRTLTEQFLRLVPPPPTTRQSLRRFLDNAAAEPDVIQHLFSADLTDTAGLASLTPISTGQHTSERITPQRPDGRILTTAKIKITTKCNRDCDFCIFAARNQGVNMPPATFHAILDRLATIPYRQLHINGGEPTVHKDFVAFSHDARAAATGRVMVLGTNAITIARNQRLRDTVLACYDQVLIGCDDEHHNYAHVARVVPVLRAHGKTVVVNSVLEGISADRLRWLAELCQTHGAIHVTNHVHHIDVGQPANTPRGLCHRNRDQHLMIQEDGSCYRCFNAMAAVDSEFSVWDDDFADKLFAERTDHYQFCAKCHEYTDSGIPPRPAKPVTLPLTVVDEAGETR